MTKKEKTEKYYVLSLNTGALYEWDNFEYADLFAWEIDGIVLDENLNQIDYF